MDQNFYPGNFPAKDPRRLHNDNHNPTRNRFGHPHQHPIPPYHQKRPMHPQQTPSRRDRASFDSAVPQFYAADAELNPYQRSYDTGLPSSTVGGLETGVVEQFVVNTHTQHVRDLVQANQRIRENSEEIYNVREQVGKDIRTLESMVIDLRKQMSDQAQAQHDVNSIKQLLDRDFGPTAEMLRSHSLGNIQKAYHQNIEYYREVVAKLEREYAELFTTNGHPHDDGDGETPRLLEGPEQKIGAEKATITDIGKGDCESSPTSVLSHQVKLVPSSHAIETKAPPKHSEPGPQQVEEASKELSAPGECGTQNPPSDSKFGSDTETPITSASVPRASSPWKPLAVRSMPPTPVSKISNMETFSWDFLRYTLGGEQWSPGFYFVSENSILPGSAYWMLDGEFEPFIPSEPGEHGAKISAFFNPTSSPANKCPDESNYLATPIFVRKEGEDEYAYYGNYSQLRFSDKLDYDRIMDTVPAKVRQFWAEELSAQARPAWVTQELVDHFWPKPTYAGPIPADPAAGALTATTDDASASSTTRGAALEPPVQRALEAYADELRAWKKHADLRFGMLMKDDDDPRPLLETFQYSDADEEPGLRLWWEYLQCVAYDQEFYEFLVKSKRLPPRGLVVGPAKPGGPELPPLARPGGHQPPAAAKPQKAGPAKPDGDRRLVSHPIGSKPWDQDDGARNNFGGDLELAKKMHQEFKTGSRY